MRRERKMVPKPSEYPAGPVGLKPAPIGAKKPGGFKRLKVSKAKKL